MKLFRLTTNYPNYINKFYNKNKNLINSNYEIQYNKLMDDCYGWANFWTKSLKQYGYIVWEPVSNAEYQQKQWANERKIKYNENSWMLDISAEQIKEFKPDVLFINDYHSFSYDFINFIKSNNKSLKLVIGWCGAPYKDESVFKAYDILLTNLPVHEKYFNSQGLQCYLMNHAFEPGILDKLNRNENCDNFNFLGSIILGSGFHNERLKLISYLLSETDLVLYSDINPPPSEIYNFALFKKYTLKIIKKLSGNKYYKSNILTDLFLSKIGLNDKYLVPFFNRSIHSRTKPGLYGTEMYNKLLNTNFTLNQHIDISKGSSNNMRLFEATGVGTCVITDWSSDLKDKFEIDYEIISYKNQFELLEKYKYLIENPKVAMEVGKKGQKKTLSENTFNDRSLWLDKLIKKRLNK